VAWLSCQPYLPCILLATLALLCYLRAHEPGRAPRSVLAWTLAAFGLFVPALLFKAVAVTLPAVLVIVDVYPLKRLGVGKGLDAWIGPRERRVWMEKISFFAVSLVFAMIALRSKATFHESQATRLATAGYAVWFYPVKTLVPFGLSVLYMPLRRVDLWHPLYFGAAIGVVIATVAAFRLRRRWPGLTGAWVSYLAWIPTQQESPNDYRGFWRLSRSNR
jgi:protein O-mannosyl-transferase